MPNYSLHKILAQGSNVMITIGSIFFVAAMLAQPLAATQSTEPLATEPQEQESVVRKNSL